MDGTPIAVTPGAHWYCWQCCVGLAPIVAAEDVVLVVMTTTGRAREITRNTGGGTVVHGRDGTIRQKDSTGGRDPYPPKV